MEFIQTFSEARNYWGDGSIIHTNTAYYRADLMSSVIVDKYDHTHGSMPTITRWYVRAGFTGIQFPNGQGYVAGPFTTEADAIVARDDFMEQFTVITPANIASSALQVEITNAVDFQSAASGPLQVEVTSLPTRTIADAA